VKYWFSQLKARNTWAYSYTGPDPSLPPATQQAVRRQQQLAFELELMQLCAPYMGTSTPLHTLYKSVQSLLPELFVFVARTKTPAHNNLAERSMRPLVIARKISDGS
jgi:hypothetical protein